MPEVMYLVSLSRLADGRCTSNVASRELLAFLVLALATCTVIV